MRLVILLLFTLSGCVSSSEYGDSSGVKQVETKREKREEGFRHPMGPGTSNIGQGSDRVHW